MRKVSSSSSNARSYRLRLGIISIAVLALLFLLSQGLRSGSRAPSLFEDALASGHIDDGALHALCTSRYPAAGELRDTAAAGPADFRMNLTTEQQIAAEAAATAKTTADAMANVVVTASAVPRDSFPKDAFGDQYLAMVRAATMTQLRIRHAVAPQYKSFHAYLQLSR